MLPPGWARERAGSPRHCGLCVGEYFEARMPAADAAAGDDDYLSVDGTGSCALLAEGDSCCHPLGK